MTTGSGSREGLAVRVAAQTPGPRDRYLDALRVLALGMVILGHWLVRVVIAPGGEVQAGYLLAMAPGWQWATLLWQVMPLFFLVGGVVNAASWRRARQAGQTPVGWLRARARRLLRPALPLLAIMVPAGVIVEITVPGRIVIDPGVALIPLWFLAAYLAVTALTPWSVAVHERGLSLPLIAVAAVGSGAFDLLRLAGVGPVLGTQPLVGVPNFLLVWGAIHQLGHLWADNRLPARPAGQAALAATGAAGLAVLIGLAGWPLSMVPIEGTLAPNNAAPPTLALLALALVQTGIALLLRPAVTRLLRRPRAWAAVALPGAVLMTLFLWHQVALLLVANVAVPAGWLPVGAALDAEWWRLRPLWLAACAAALLPLFAAFYRFEAPAGAPPEGGMARTLLGVALVAAGLAGVLWVRAAGAQALLALPALGVVLLGFLALGVMGQAGRGGRGPAER